MKRLIAALVVMTGAGLVAAGAAEIYEPAGFIVAGLAVAALGLFGYDVDNR